MPNGKPGDHPLTDIVVHNIEVFGSEIDDKVRRIHAASPPAVRGHLDALLYWWPTQNPNDANSPILNSKGMSYVLDALLEYVRRHDVEGFGLEIDDKVKRIHAVSPSSLRRHLDALLYWWLTQNPNDDTRPILNPKGLSYVLDALLDYVRERYGETDKA